MNLIEDGKGTSLKEISDLLFARKWSIVTIALLVFGSVAGFTYRTPKQYRAHMKILVKNERADMIVSADRNGGTASPGEVGEAQINTEIELLNSTNLLEQVVLKSGLERREDSNEMAGVKALPLLTERAILRLQRDLKISAVHKANVIQIEYESADPRLAAQVLRQLADLYLEAHLKVHGTPGTYEFFKVQAARYQAELRDTEMRLSAFRQSQNIVVLAQEKDITLQRASAAASLLLQTETAVAEYQDKLTNIRKQLVSAEPRVVTQSRTIPNQDSVERFHTLLVELQNKRSQLLAKFRSDDRSVMEVDQEIAETQAALETANKRTGVQETTDVNPVRQALEIDLSREQAALAGAQARRQSLAQQTQTYRQQLTRLGAATAAEDELVRNRKEAEDDYLLYAKKMEEARIAESLDQQKIANVAIAETPTEPLLSSSPNVGLNLALGALVACFLSLSSAFAAEYFSNTVARPADLEELTGLPILATVSINAALPAGMGRTLGAQAGGYPSSDPAGGS